MRYRALSATGDYQFGHSGLFLINTPAAVAQAIRTRLMLWVGEWFLDSTEGTPYEQSVLGYGTQGTRDLAIKERILGTPGVLSILKYASSVNSARRMSVEAIIETQFGTATLNLQA